MVRCEMKEGKHITIAYGSDEFIGYILSVYDDREAYDICEAVEPSGSGCYHGLVTGFGIGKTVSKATMEFFWKRLAPNIEASEAVNKICNVDDPAVEKACGAYLQLTTDDKPNVEKVAKETLAVFYEHQTHVARSRVGGYEQGGSGVEAEDPEDTIPPRVAL
ncbi:hypothetical protein GGF50DRAFT_89754 [Schizophyllum commune]